MAWTLPCAWHSSIPPIWIMSLALTPATAWIRHSSRNQNLTRNLPKTGDSNLGLAILNQDLHPTLVSFCRETKVTEQMKMMGMGWGHCRAVKRVGRKTRRNSIDCSQSQTSSKGLSDLAELSRCWGGWHRKVIWPSAFSDQTPPSARRLAITYRWLHG